MRTGQPLEAAKDVRQLAWLAYRTDTILGGVLATTLLQFERETMKYMKPLAEARYQESYTALREDLDALSCPTSLARGSWERGVTFGGMQDADRHVYRRSRLPGRRPEDVSGAAFLVGAADPPGQAPAGAPLAAVHTG
ncbi:MAG TPA: hypothetical protein VNA24_26980 [Hyalangium sp.]|nr:hypothetical protein [Hyalangium sp.]